MASNSTTITLFLVILSGIFCAMPDMWNNHKTPLYAGIIILTNAILMFIYTALFHRSSFNQIDNSIMGKMVLSGLLLFVSWVLFLQTVKHKKYTIMALFWVVAFIASSIISVVVFGTKVTRYNTIGIILCIIGMVFIVWSEADIIDSFQYNPIHAINILN